MSQAAEPALIKSRPRRWLQFRLRSLMLAMLILPMGLGWLAQARSKSQKAWENVAEIKLLCSVNNASFDRSANPWWQKMLGVDMPRSVEDLSVEFLEGPDEAKQIQLLNRLRAFSKLRSLKVSEPFRSVSAMAPLQHLQTLQQLTLVKGDGDGTDEDLLTVAKLPRLKQFDDFGFSRFSHSEVEALATSQGLEELSIDCKISDVDWSRFRGLRLLRVANMVSSGLYLDPDNHHDKDIAQIAKLQGLESLELKYVNVSPQGVMPLTLLKNLKSVRLLMSVISDEAIASLANVPSLETLEIESRSVTQEAIDKWSLKRPGFTIIKK